MNERQRGAGSPPRCENGPGDPDGAPPSAKRHHGAVKVGAGAVGGVCSGGGPSDQDHFARGQELSARGGRRGEHTAAASKAAASEAAASKAAASKAAASKAAASTAAYRKRKISEVE